jgi:hypothetical protein
MRFGNIDAANAQGADPLPKPDDGQGQAMIQGLAGHIRNFWTQANAARTVVEQDLLESLRARKGEYTPAKLQLIQEQGQPGIYMMVGAAKMRQVEALLRDVLMGAGTEKPWTASPTPVPDLPPALVEQLVAQLTGEIEQAAASGFPPSMEAAQARLRAMRDELGPLLVEEAQKKCEAMELKMEDQLLEGGFTLALDQFITDLATFKTAFIAGPIVRNKPQLSWGEFGDMVVETKLCLEWERVDPFDVYPAPWASCLTKSPFIRKHRLTRQGLNEMVGVEGFNEEAIRGVLAQYSHSGHREWSNVDAQKEVAEGKIRTSTTESGLIDALQYWGSASGQTLLDWGMPKQQVPDATKEYQIEAWLINHVVIKAVLNADPLARRPVYHASFQMVPGQVWGESPYDLLRDCQDMCNAAARSLAANLGIASGPQVAIISNRLPAGEDVTEMRPWKIWQFESDPMGSTAKPIEFFQPQSNAQELMNVYERFSALADEYTGIPRYMSGFGGEGAGNTASGMSMMIGNASKTIKQVLGTIDTYVLVPMIDRQYYYNMRYGDDPELKGDIKVVARGAASLQAKEAAQVRTHEFLQATGNPIDMQIIGLEGRAELLRHAAKNLDMNTNKVVPSVAVLKQREAQMQEQQMAQMGQGAPGAPSQAPSQGPGQGNQPPGNQPSQKPGRNLMNGAPESDHFTQKAQ